MKNLIKKKLFIHYTNNLVSNTPDYYVVNTAHSKETLLNVSSLFFVNSIGLKSEQSFKKPIKIKTVEAKRFKIHSQILHCHKNLYCCNAEKKMNIFFNTFNSFIALVRFLFFISKFLIKLKKYDQKYKT